MRDWSRRLCLAAGIILAVGACGGSTNTPSNPATNQRVSLKIMVGGLNKQIYIPNMLTKQLGYFDEQNLDVTLIDEGSVGVEEEVLAGNADLGSGSYNHTIDLQALGKYVETVAQLQVAPGEAEMVASKKADQIKTAADLKGKNLGVTSIGSGTHVLTQALMGKVGLKSESVHFIPGQSGNTFIASMQQGKIDAGMTTEPTISRLVKSGDGKVLIDLRTPEATRAALGGDYPFISVFAKTEWVNGHKPVVQRVVNAYVKTLKWIRDHSAAQITDKMPADYYAGDKDLYISALDASKTMFTVDGKMPPTGPKTVLEIEQAYVASFQGKTADLSKTYTNEFVNKAT